MSQRTPVAVDAAEIARRFGQLSEVIQRDPESLPALVTSDSVFRTDFTARFLINYYRTFWQSLFPVVVSAITEAAAIACEDSADADLRVNALKERANAHRLCLRFADARDAVARAKEIVRVDLAQDAAFYNNVLDYAEAHVAFDMRRTEVARTLVAHVIVEFERLGETERAGAARVFCETRMAFRDRSYESVLQHCQQDLAKARECRDVDGAALAYGSIGACYMRMKRFGKAQANVSAALALCEEYGLGVLQLHVMRTSAFITMCSAGIATGLRDLERVRERCHAEGMDGEAVRCLLYGVETIIEVIEEPDAEVIVPMCQRIQVEAAGLRLDVDLAEATERLRVAAMQHRVTADMTKSLLDRIPPSARYVELRN